MIYPSYDIRKWEYWNHDQPMFHIEMRSKVRKQHEGVWFLIPVKVQYEFPIIDRMQLTQMTFEALELIHRQFHQATYNVLLFAIVDQKMVDLYGQPIYKEDISQLSERDRLRV